ncbi:type II restriction endonuclease [Rhizobium sp. KDH_Rht_773_N]
MKAVQTDLFEMEQPSASLLASLLETADAVLVKKLSNNDRDWAKFGNKHQAGVYMPPAQRDSGFFPPLQEIERPDPNAAPIRVTTFSTFWPQFDVTRETFIRHYTSKGPETHMTRLPKEAFSELSPASFLVMARTGETAYTCLTIDSASDDAILLADALELEPDFLIDIRRPADYRQKEKEVILDFVEQAIAAWLKGTIVPFAHDNAALPPTAVMAEKARRKFLDIYRLTSLDPFALGSPGDALREISRGIEWELFREFQRRERAIGLVRIIMGDAPYPVDAPSVIRSLIEKVQEVDTLMLSASQQRKSRAGYSFEHHIESMLADGNVPFEKQVVIEAKKRPDFILPSLRVLRKKDEGRAPGLILSAKTTLRERWKQVEREMGGSELFLATVDENIAANAIDDMASMGVVLVVPESLKKSKEAEYAGRKNVISFRELFSDEIASRMASWI